MKVAIVHDWLVDHRGGERVLEVLCEIFPDAPVYTLFYQKQKSATFFHGREIRVPGWLNHLSPFRKLLLPVLPTLIENFDFDAYDLVISSSSCVAMGAIARPEAKHICYLHSPMRYIWDQRFIYWGAYSKWPLFSVLAECLAKSLRQWEVSASHRVDRFLVNSSFVGQRVARYYRRESQVMHPPIDTSRFSLPTSGHTKPLGEGEFFIVVGSFVPYKRFDLAISACEALGEKLIVAGDGPLFSTLRRQAGGHTEFVVRPPDKTLLELFHRAKALIFPQVEDFGMIAPEAMCAGLPVIAYRRGGALDFIEPGLNGLFFEEPTAESLMGALREYSKQRFDRQKIRASVEDRFTKEKFKIAFQKIIVDVLKG